MPAHTRRDCSGETSADFVEIDDVGAVEDGQMHDHTGLLVQFVQKRCGRFTKRASPLAVTAPESAATEAVSEGGVLDPSEGDELIENAVDSGAR